MVEGTQELVGKGDAETVLAAVAVVALAVDGRFVGEVRRASRDESAWWVVAGRMASVEMNLNRAADAFLAGPTRDVVLVPFVAYGVNHPGNRAGGLVLRGSSWAGHHYEKQKSGRRDVPEQL